MGVSYLDGNLSVSCVIPNYNYQRFLPARFASVLAQTYPVSELIILDDASDDDSAACISSSLPALEAVIGKGRVHFIENQENHGVFHQWRKGVEFSSGDVVWIAEADDFCSPVFLERLVDVLRKNESVGIAWASSLVADECGTVIGDYIKYHEDLPGDYMSDSLVTGADEITNSFIIKNPVNNVSSAIFRKSCWRKIPESFFDFRIIGDAMIYVAMLENTNIFHLAEPLNYRREHNRSVSYHMHHHDPYSYLDEIIMMKEYIKSHYPVPKKNLEKSAEYLAHVVSKFIKSYSLEDAARLEDYFLRIDALRKLSE